MRTHLSSVAEENKLSDGSGNVGVCENPQAGAVVAAVAGAGKKAGVCESSLKVSFLQVFPLNSVCISGLLHTCYMSCPSLSSRFNIPNYVRERIQCM